MATINLGAIKFNWKGAYNSSTTYAVDDVVSSGGNSYVCIQAHSNQAVGNATAYWNIMATKGTNGTDGADADLLSIGSTAQGDLYYNNGSAIARLGAGTSGQVLKTQGASANPVWGNVVAGLVQVVSTTKTDTWSSSGSGNYQAVTGLSLNITPTSSSNKIYITSNLHLYHNDYGGGASLYRGGSQLVNPSGYGSRSIVNTSTYVGHGNGLSNLSLSYLDAPSSTSSLAYQIYVYARGGNYHINRSSDDSNTTDRARTISTITAMEIAV